jgi:chaperonin GroES
MSKLRPINGNLLLLPLDEVERTVGNIVLPDLGYEQPSCAKVIAVSDNLDFQSGNTVPCPVKVGEKVFFNKMGANKLMVDNEEYWVIHMSSITTILEE